MRPTIVKAWEKKVILGRLCPSPVLGGVNPTHMNADVNGPAVMTRANIVRRDPVKHSTIIAGSA